MHPLHLIGACLYKVPGAPIADAHIEKCINAETGARFCDKMQVLAI